MNSMKPAALGLLAILAACSLKPTDRCCVRKRTGRPGNLVESYRKTWDDLNTNPE